MENPFNAGPYQNPTDVSKSVINPQKDISLWTLQQSNSNHMPIKIITLFY
jgi:hypothetical protein